MGEGSEQSVGAASRRRLVVWMIGLTALGVGIRLVHLLLAGDLEPFADESNYLYLALSWNRFGFYSDCGIYLWPPGYPLFLATCLRLFGFEGILVARLFQVLLSGVVGATVMLLADLLFTRRAVVVAGLIWAIYLPLVGLTHYLLTETLFLATFVPSVYLVLSWWRESARSGARDRRLAAAGILLGLSMLIKEIGLGWGVLVVLLIVYRDGRRRLGRGVSRAVLFGLSVSVVVFPWSLRNYEVYGRIVPVGATLGQNLYWGLNGFYFNADYPRSEFNRVCQANAWVHGQLAAPATPPWEHSNAANVIDRAGEDVRRGLGYAWRHPGYAARTRLKKLADWATPLSPYVRHCALGRYQGLLADPAVHRLRIVLALVLSVLVLAGSVGGFFWSLGDPGARMVLGWTLAYFILATALVNGISRYRMAIEPLLIVLAAGFVSVGLSRLRVRPETIVFEPPRGLKPAARWVSGRTLSKGQVAVCVLGWVVLAGLWWINSAEIIALVKAIW